MSSQDDLDWTGVSEDTARQVLALGEAYLSAQLQAGLAADQRAVTVASILSAASLAFLGAGIAHYQAAKSAPLLSAAVATAAVLMLAAACGAWAARPIAFWFPGNTPSNWYDVLRGDIVQNIGGEAENYADRIAMNNQILSENQAALMFGMVVAILSPAIGAAAWYFASIQPHA